MKDEKRPCTRKDGEKEHEMLRTEILQYLEEYQNVRNMMYVVTAAILGINSYLFLNYYLFLLPLIVILPSYMIFYSYWKAVTCASTYIQVFLEDDDDMVQNTYRWESRLRYFSCLQAKPKRGMGNRLRKMDMHTHHIPYFICSALCLLLYWIGMIRNYLNPYLQESIADTLELFGSSIINNIFDPEWYCLLSTWHCFFDVLLGIAIAVIFVVLFVSLWDVRKDEISQVWTEIKVLSPEKEGALRQELKISREKGKEL